jgi:hypothetical protein
MDPPSQERHSMTETLPWNWSVTANGVIMDWTPYGLPLHSSSSSLSSLASTSSGSDGTPDGAERSDTPCPMCSVAPKETHEKGTQTDMAHKEDASPI